MLKGLARVAVLENFIRGRGMDHHMDVLGHPHDSVLQGRGTLAGQRADSSPCGVAVSICSVSE